MNLLQRAYQGLNLSPTERAILKLGQGIVIAALGSAFAAVAQVLAVGTVTDPATVAQVGGIAFGVAVLNALHKYWSAQTDQPLFAPLGALAGTLASDLGANAPKVPLVDPNAAPAPAPVAVAVDPSPTITTPAVVATPAAAAVPAPSPDSPVPAAAPAN